MSTYVSYRIMCDGDMCLRSSNDFSTLKRANHDARRRYGIKKVKGTDKHLCLRCHAREHWEAARKEMMP